MLAPATGPMSEPLAGMRKVLLVVVSLRRRPLNHGMPELVLFWLKRRKEPSGVQAGLKLFKLGSARYKGFWFLPSLSINQIILVTDMRVKAIVFPSGDQTAPESTALELERLIVSEVAKIKT